MFFAHTSDGADGVITHVGIALGNGQFVGAQGSSVNTASLTDPFRLGHVAGYRTVS